jgi:hypothetical protein
MVDAEQLAAFMSGVLKSTLSYLNEKPNENIYKHVSTLISLLRMLIDKCLGEKIDSERVRSCLELLEHLKKRPGVHIIL